VRFARSVGLVRGEWVAIDGSKFQSVSSVDRIREREALKRYAKQSQEVLYFHQAWRTKPSFAPSMHRSLVVGEAS
jgi:hypothetical protein